MQSGMQRLGWAALAWVVATTGLMACSSGEHSPDNPASRDGGAVPDTGASPVDAAPGDIQAPVSCKNDCCDRSGTPIPDFSRCTPSAAPVTGYCHRGECRTSGYYDFLTGLSSEVPVRAISWLPNGQAVAATNLGSPGATILGSAAVWKTGEIHASYILPRPGRGVAMHPNGTLLAVGASPLTMYNHPATEPVQTFREALGPVAFSPDGKWMAAASANSSNHGILLYNAATLVQEGQMHQNVEGAGLNLLAWSPDSSLLLAGFGPHQPDSTAGELTLWRMDGTSAGPSWACPVRAAGFSPDGKKVIGACGSSVKIWNASTGEEEKSVSWAGTQVLSVAYSPDGARVAVGTSKGLLIYAEKNFSADAEPVSAFPNSEAGVIAYSPDGSYLIMSKGDRPELIRWRL
ncbi:MAG: hypothetical protein GMKNLPBB_01647 [Myxococcota bacterium]|nr:hypothetical protein [Myxococcota bacterium]